MLYICYVNNDKQTHKTMTIQANNLNDLVAKINPVGYAFNQRHIREEVKKMRRSILTIDGLKYEIRHMGRANWVAISQTS